jgi:hypothetical protein
MRRVQLLAALTCAALVSVAVPSAASAATITVCPSGCSYATPQEAVSAAHDGDDIAISPGTYGDGITIPASFSTSGLTIRGAGQDATTLTDGISLANADPIDGLTLQDLTISGASDGDSSAVVSTFYSAGGIDDLTLRSVTIDGGGNDLTLFAGHNLRGTFTVADSTLRNTTAPCVLATSCAAAVPPDGSDYPTHVVFDHNTVRDATGAVILRGAGGAAPLTSVAVTDSAFEDEAISTADGPTGALMLRSVADLTLTGNRFARISGVPALSLRGITNVDIQRNSVEASADGALVVEPSDDEDPDAEHWHGTVAGNRWASSPALRFPSDFEAADTTISANTIGGTVAGPVVADDNWWGCNGGPASCGTLTDGAAAAHWLQLSASADPTSIPLGGTSTVSALMRDNVSGAAAPAAPVTIAFENATAIQPQIDGTTPATARFTGGSAGTQVVRVTVDGGATFPVQISVVAPAAAGGSDVGTTPAPPGTSPLPPALPDLSATLQERLTQESQLAGQLLVGTQAAQATGALSSPGCLVSLIPVQMLFANLMMADGCAFQHDMQVALDAVKQLMAQLAAFQQQFLAALRSDIQHALELQAQMAAQLQQSMQAVLAAQLAAYQDLFGRGIAQLGQLNGLQALAQSTYQQALGTLGSKGTKGRAVAASARLTRAEARKKLLAVEAQLRAVVTPLGAPPKRAVLRVRRHGATPVLTVACPTQRCHVTARRSVRVGHRHARLRRQSLTAGAHARVLRLRLPRKLHKALSRTGHGTLKLTLSVGGERATTRYALRPLGS